MKEKAQAAIFSFLFARHVLSPEGDFPSLEFS